MTAAIVALAIAVAVLAGVLCALLYQQGRERREWASERRSLVDRAIAQHSGEIIALDRAANRTDKGKPPEPVLIEGLT